MTELGLGAAPLGELFEKIPDEDAAAIIGAAGDGGVRHFDTSPWYGRGLAEHTLGRALYRKPRDQYVISIKIGRVLARPYSTPSPDGEGWKPCSSVEASRSREAPIRLARCKAPSQRSECATIVPRARGPIAPSVCACAMTPAA